LAAKRLYSAAIDLEKVVRRSGDVKRPPGQVVTNSLTAFSTALNQTLDAINLLVPEETGDQSHKHPDAKTGLPTEVAQSAAERLREAAELGDLTELETIVEEFTARIPSFSEYAMRISRMAEDFDFEGIMELAEQLLRGND
jgi:hypothetical protein